MNYEDHRYETSGQIQLIMGPMFSGKTTGNVNASQLRAGIVETFPRSLLVLSLFFPIPRLFAWCVLIVFGCVFFDVFMHGFCRTTSSHSPLHGSQEEVPRDKVRRRQALQR